VCHIQVSNEASLSAFRADRQHKLIRRGRRDGFLAADRAHTEGTQHRQHQHRGDQIRYGSNHERQVPTSCPGGEDAADGHEERGAAFRGIEQRVVGGGVLVAEVVRSERRENTEDVAPGEEDQSGKDYEIDRMLPYRSR